MNTLSQSTVESKLWNARLTINQIFPFYAALMYLVRFHSRPGIGTLACDQRANVYYDPDLTWNQQEINYVFLHEVNHLARLHFKRWELKGEADETDLNPIISNLAADCEINGETYEICNLSERFEFPAGGILPTTFNMPDKQLAETYYDLLIRRAKKEQQLFNKSHTDCGSAADGQPRDYEIPPDQSSNSDSKVENAAGQVADELRKWKKEVDNSNKKDRDGQSKGDKSNPGGRQAGDEQGEIQLSALPQLLKSRMWLDRIRQTINEYRRLRTYGYSRPNRRYYNPPFIMPGRQYTYPTISFLCDVSGSINMTSAHQSFRVIDQLKGLGIKCRIFACDTRAFEVKDRHAAYTGGGTHLPTGLELIKSTVPETDLCIIISDGQTGWDDKPHFPVVMFSWDEEGPSWMKTIMMPEL